MSWRQLLPEERFVHDHNPQEGRFCTTHSPNTTDEIVCQLHMVCPNRPLFIERGYAVETVIFLAGHETCSCDRAREPDRVTWFLAHQNTEHGHYPLHSSYINGHISHDRIIAQLRTQLRTMSLGFIVHRLPSTVSYGRILRRCTTCRSVWT
jgi:hypothetical protein